MSWLKPVLKVGAAVGVAFGANKFREGLVSQLVQDVDQDQRSVKSPSVKDLTGAFSYPDGITKDVLGFVSYMPYEHTIAQAGLQGAKTAVMNQLSGEPRGQGGPLQINLHMPEDLSDNIEAKWSAEEDAISKLTKAGTAGFDAAAIVGGGKIIKALGGEDATKGMERRIGVVSRPFEEQFFGGTDFRTFDFTHKLIAFNKEETVTINKIIKMLRYYSSPGLVAGDMMFSYPATWRIRFYNADPNNDLSPKESQWLPTLHRCVLTKVEVKHFNSCTPSYHTNLAPTDIEISLSFMETKYVTRESIVKENQPKWGGGSGGDLVI